MKDYKNIFVKGKSSCYRESYISEQYPELYSYLIEHYPQDLSFRERIYWYLHDIEEHPKCAHCGKVLRFVGGVHGYFRYCTLQCSQSCPEVIQKKKLKMYRPDGTYGNPEKFKQTCRERYGGNAPACSETIKNKIKATNLERYGAEYTFNTDEFQKRAKETKLEKYGSENYTNSEKRKRTCLERYGIDNTLGGQFREKHEQIKLEKYGDKHYNNREKQKRTCLERYGVESTFSAEFQKEKTKKTLQQKYGVDFPSQNPLISEKMRITKRNRILNLYPEIIEILPDYTCICRCPHPECNLCTEKNYIISRNVFRQRRNRNDELCTRLTPIQHNKISGTSVEAFIKMILSQYNIEYKTNVRNIISPKELDIYIPSHNIAIECNGVFWHNFYKTQNKNKHSIKYQMCQEKGVQLLTFWEDQIKNFPEIVRSVILSRLGIFEKTINSDECIVKEINSKTCNDFLEDNYLHGNTKSSLYLGLFYNDMLVGTMSLSKVYKHDGKDWNLDNVCFLKNLNVQGGIEKLFNYFTTNIQPDFVTTSSFNDTEDEKIYLELGFSKIETVSNTWYIDRYYNRYKRISKNEQIYKNINIPLDKSRNFYYLIYDTGKTKYIWKAN